MATDIPGTVISRSEYVQTEETTSKEVDFEQTGVSQNDTISLQSAIAVGTGVVLKNKVTGANIAATISTYTVTVTGACTNVTVRGTAQATS